jgi:hypothetical protein
MVAEIEALLLHRHPHPPTPKKIKGAFSNLKAKDELISKSKHINK